MPNFTATICTSYRDISGLIGSFARKDIEEDPDNEGHVVRWRNRAPGLPSLPLIRGPADPVIYWGGRFGDFWQRSKSNQPELAIVNGQRKVKFSKAAQTYLSATTPASQIPRGSAIVFQYARGDDDTDRQVLYTDQSQSWIIRRTSSDSAAAQFLIGTVTAVGADSLQDGLWLVTADDNEVMASRDNGLDIVQQDGNGQSEMFEETAFLGKELDGNYLDGYLDSFHVWGRELSPMEQSFIWSTIDEDGRDLAGGEHARMSIRRWTDITGMVGSNQINRIRNESAQNPYYKFANVSGTSQRILIIASEEGMVKHDDDLLQGEPFVLTWVESPGVFPAVYQDPGWSSVFDVSITHTGHYVARVSREMGGAVYLHFDAEVIP